MIDTDITVITLPPHNINWDLARSHAMILTSPPPLPQPRLRVGVVRVTSDSYPLSYPRAASAAYISVFLTTFTSELKPHASKVNVRSLKT